MAFYPREEKGKGRKGDGEVARWGDGDITLKLALEIEVNLVGERENKPVISD